jgi:hypothetical protein
MPLQIDTTNMLLTNSSYNLSQIVSQNASTKEILTLIENFIEKYYKTENIQNLLIELPQLIEKLNLLVALDLRFI